MADYSMNPHSCAYIESFGINPKRIPLDGWDATGYDFINGDGEMGDPTLPRGRHEWPSDFDYQRLLELWAADAPTRGGH